MPIALRSDHDAARLRAAARQSHDAGQTRRLLALAAIYDGSTRTEAAAIGGVTLQIVRDWVLKLNERGPDGLVGGKAPGPGGAAARLGFSIVAGWAAISVLGVIVMSETRIGPFARFATGFLGLQDFAGIATFLLGLPVLLSPLLLLALLPWLARRPLIAGMQGAVKWPPSPTRRRQRR